MALALGLAVAAIAGTVLAWAPSVLAGLIAIPVGLYAAAATSRPLVPVAFLAVVAGAVVIAWWIYELVVAISG